MEDAGLYWRGNVLQTRDVIAYLERTLEEASWSAGERVLDVGCGPGSITAFLRPYIPVDAHVIGGDVCNDMITFANAFYKDFRTEFRLLDIENENLLTAWEGEKFDKIFSFYCFHWVKNHRSAVNNLYSLLKDGGEIFLLFLQTNPMYYILSEFRKLEPFREYANNIPEGKFALHENSRDPDVWAKDFKAHLKEAGFRNIKINLSWKIFWYQSMDALVGTLEGIDPFLKYIPQENRKQYFETMKKIIQDLKMVWINPDNKRVYTKYLLVDVNAKKI